MELVAWRHRCDRLLPAPASLRTAQLVDQPPRRDPDQPAAGVVRGTGHRPLLRGGEQRLLNRVLGGIEVAVPPHERAEDLRRKLAQQVPDRRRCGHATAGASSMGLTTTSEGAVPAGSGHSWARLAISV